MALVGIIIVIIATSDGLLLQQGPLALLFYLIGRSEQVSAVLDDLRAGDAPLQHLRGEVVAVAQVREAHDEICGLGVLDQTQRGDDADVQALREEGAALHVQLHKAALQVLRSQPLQVQVHDLAARAVNLVEVTYDVFAFLGDLEKLLFIW